MNYTQSFTVNPTHLYCLTAGAVTDAQSLIDWGLAIVRMAQEKKRPRILVDNREFILELSPLDVVEFASYFEERDIAFLGLRLAVLSSPSRPQTTRLVETALTNRSASYRRFTSTEEAQAWLES
ncbi:hypothetical protein [Pseudodesulfovibrio sp.]|uniref:hypothetical protein n=1 Tax=Pseudodesulfovibrio sp. TaxID=2035812 RepID=UPI002614DB2A|nr:hypothetical protein [Pseudodesulfovibrio sp.]MDD3313405.1 hypothetical protein [Pseudodesulfovibrio sp.]